MNLQVRMVAPVNSSRNNKTKTVITIFIHYNRSILSIPAYNGPAVATMRLRKRKIHISSLQSKLSRKHKVKGL